MKNNCLALFIVAASLPVAPAAAVRAQSADESYTAAVKRDEARFTLTVPDRREWKWLQPETREREREYQMAVNVKNEGREYNFGFFLWKFSGSRPHTGSLAQLIEAGQESLFQRNQLGHNIIVRDAGVKVRNDGNRLIITVRGRKNVERLFSGRPAEVVFLMNLPGERPTARNIPVKYED